MLTPDDYKVADLSLAGFGRKEIELAEHEMPGLMAIRALFTDEAPLKGAQITGSVPMQLPVVHTSVSVQASPSSQPVSSGTFDVVQAPLLSLQRF